VVFHLILSSDEAVLFTDPPFSEPDLSRMSAAVMADRARSEGRGGVFGAGSPYPGLEDAHEAALS
jgi:hypothetical protein